MIVGGVAVSFLGRPRFTQDIDALAILSEQAWEGALAVRQRLAMFVFEITTPGTWLDYKGREWAWHIEGLLCHMQAQFVEANTALNLFVQACSVRRTRLDPASWERETRRRSEIRTQVEQEFDSGLSRELWDEIHFETEVRFKREQSAQGRVPREFEHTTPFIYAKAFLYALDAFDKFLGVLSQEPGVPPELTALHGQVATAFPNLRGVRNTAQHLEDRARGLGAGRDPKPMDLNPVENQLLSAPRGGALVLNSLNGSRYGSTMADGHFGEVDVSPESMRQLHRIFHDVLRSFCWQGPKQHSPSA